MSDYDTGMRTRREVLGDEHVDRATGAAGEFGEPFQDFITRYAWGAVWSRPGIDRRMRSAITLTALVCVRAEHELGMHVRAALRNGLTVEEIREILLHSGVYAGVPAANRAFSVAREVLEQEGAL
jgi:4-carboxymuconolactone decarboxylase